MATPTAPAAEHTDGTTPAGRSSATPTTGHGELRRGLGPGLLTLYGVGVMVGAGIYVLVGTVAGEAGLLAPLAFLAAGLVAAPTALAYAELSVRFPESAGEAAYVRHAFRSQRPSTAIGLAITAVGVTSAAAVLRGGVGYVTELIEVDTATLTIVIAAALIAIAVWGVVESLAFAAVFTAIEVVGLLLVIRAGIIAAPSSDWSGGLPDEVAWGGLGLAMVLAFFAFVGFEDIVNMAEEVKNPDRTLPIAIVTSLAVTSLLYGAVAIAAVRVVDLGALADSDRPLALVYEQTGADGGVLIAIAGIAALNGVLAQMVMASRVLFGLGRQEPRLSFFHQASATLGTPTRATLVVGAIVLATALSVDVAALAEVTSIVLLVVFTVINSALIVLKCRGTEAGGFTVSAWVPWAGLAGSAAALVVALVVAL